MLTADTITDEQLRDLYKDRANLTTEEQRAVVAALAPSFGREAARRQARARCAEILNARAARTDRAPQVGAPQVGAPQVGAPKVGDVLIATAAAAHKLYLEPGARMRVTRVWVQDGGTLLSLNDEDGGCFMGQVVWPTDALVPEADRAGRGTP